MLDVSSLKIVLHPAPVLRQKAAPVALSASGQVSEETKAIVARMLEVMRKHNGIGLAAPQIGIAQRIFIVDVPEDQGDEEEGWEPRLKTDDPPGASDGLQVYLNPVLHKPSRESDTQEEGCLSLPKIRGRVMRPMEIAVTAIGLDGKAFTSRGGELLARCWQHEYDHLEGVLIIDRMLQADRLKTKKALKDLEARQEPARG